MKVEPINTESGVARALELAASYAHTMKHVRRPSIGDILTTPSGGLAQVLSVANGGQKIEVQDASGQRVTLTREAMGWWTRA